MSRFAGVPVLVAGAGASGVAAARALLRLGAAVTVTDQRAGAGLAEVARLGARTEPGLATPPPGTALLVTSPGWRPDNPLLRAAAAHGVEVIGEVELAWRIAHDEPAAVPAAPWLALTGTNGKTTTVRMLEAMLRAAGFCAVATGNVGLPVVDAVLAEPPYDVLAVELSSFQLHWSTSLRPAAAAILNIAPDHLDWHGSMAEYTAQKGRIYHAGATNVVNLDDPAVVRLAAGHEPTVGVTLGVPGPGQLGVSDGVLVDRAFGTDLELAAVTDVTPAGPHNVANALAAAALARSHGVPADAVHRGLRSFVPDPHRNSLVDVVAGVRYVDDSKATNPHAADASLGAHERVVWIAGGQLKGASVDDVVARHHGRLVGAVLLGADRHVVRAAIARHAPDVPVLEVGRTDDRAMGDVVAAAAGLARPGDTVLLAPAAASLDMFPDYAARGDAFADEVRARAARHAPDRTDPAPGGEEER